MSQPVPSPLSPEVDGAAAGGVAAADAAPADEAGWHRLHKVTPVLKGWKIIAFALVFFTQQRGDDLLSGGGVPGGREVLITLGLLALFGVLAAVWAFLSWRMTRYRVDQDVLQLHSGVLFRQQRQVRLDRLQAVDVVQPLLGRFLGLSELKLEVAGGAGSDAKLAYLRAEDAQRLRNVLLARAAGVRYDGEAPLAPEDQLVSLPVDRLVWSLVRSGATLGLVLAIVALVVAAFVRREALFVVVPMLLGFVSGYWGQFSRGFNFEVASSPDGLRLRHGLLETRSQTVPPGRVQAVQLTQPLLWRGPDWWKLQVNVAGYGVSGEGQQSETVLVPVATRSEAYLVLSRILPDLGHPDPLALLEAGLTGAAADATGTVADVDPAGFVCAPRRSRWLDLVSWRRHGVAVSGRALLLRSGRVRRRLVIVPHERTQSLNVFQGPIQRRLRLASLVAHSTAGPVSPRVDHLDAGTAGLLLMEQAERARQARASSGPERWMDTKAP